MKPSVTVIIPTYNHASYLGYALHSVLDQTFADWEAIVVDDGSTDDPQSVVARFADPRIRYTYQRNRGLSAARNAGILLARGTFLAFLDADDEWESTFLERCLSVLSVDETLAGAYTGTHFVDEGGSLLPQLGITTAPREAFHRRICQGGFFPVHAAVLRAAAVRQAGLFDTELTSLEDWDLWIRISKHHEMQGIPEPLVRYRVCPGSMSTNAHRMDVNRIAVLTKHFGPPRGDPATWPQGKRHAYGFGYRDSALASIQQGECEAGWQSLARAVAVWPPLMSHLDTFCELACADQAKGYRGQAATLDIERNGAEMLRRVDDLFSTAEASVRALRGVGCGHAYMALAVLSDRTGQWGLARAYLLRALGSHPALLLDRGTLRRLLKLCAGKRLVDRLRVMRWRGARQLPVGGQ